MILAHDLGTTGNKASLYSRDGLLVGSQTEAYATDFGPHGRAEQNAEDWWRAVVQGTQQLLESTGTQPADIDCIVFSGQMMAVVPLDGDGEPVRHAMIWADTRSQEECDQLIEMVGMERAYQITGHRLNPTYSLPKMMWLRRTEPALWKRVRTIAQPKDFVAYRLTGRLATDPSDASGMDAFDQTRGVWSDELLSAAEIDESLLPEIVPSTTVLGGVTKSAAAATGLLPGTPVVVGGGDGPCAALGAGVVRPESGAYTYLGSSSWISHASVQPLHDPSMRTMTFNHVVPGMFLPTATMQAGGASFDWIVDLLRPDRDPERFEQLLAAAADVDTSADGLLFLPYLLGERSPYWNPRARGAFVGLARHHGQAHMVHAVLEGVAMNLYTAVLAFAEMGSRIESVDAIGGGARSDLWLQISSDVWKLPVRRRSIVEEANGLGAAVVGGVAVGLFPDFDVAATLSAVQAEFAPDEERHNRYETLYGLFLDSYRALEPIFDEL
jgi:xylulokinase